MSYELDDLALQLPCPFCGADPGYWCVTARPYRLAPGRITTWLHTARTQPVRDAWRIGHHQGAQMAYVAAAQRLDARLRGDHWARDMPTDPQGIVRWLRSHSDRAE